VGDVVCVQRRAEADGDDQEEKRDRRQCDPVSEQATPG